MPRRPDQGKAGFLQSDFSGLNGSACSQRSNVIDTIPPDHVHMSPRVYRRNILLRGRNSVNQRNPVLNFLDDCLHAAIRSRGIHGVAFQEIFVIDHLHGHAS